MNCAVTRDLAAYQSSFDQAMAQQDALERAFDMARRDELTDEELIDAIDDIFCGCKTGEFDTAIVADLKAAGFDIDTDELGELFSTAYTACDGMAAQKTLSLQVAKLVNAFGSASRALLRQSHANRKVNA